MSELSDLAKLPELIASNDDRRLKALAKARLLGAAFAPKLGRFVLVRRLGQGANGAVYEARDPRDGRTIALKVLRRVNSSGVLGFKQEFRALSHIAHENLVQLYELFADANEWFFTMELVPGRSFTDHAWVHDEPRTSFDEQKLRAALLLLLSAIRAIHAAGRLHCDLKPSNVLVTEAGRVVVLDFGLVTLAQHEPATGGSVGHVQGTPGYIAPELHGGHAPSAASDAYAIGVMLFEALTGSRPLHTWREPFVARALDLQPGIARDLAAVCHGLLAPEPADRLSVDEALRQLGADSSAEPARSVHPAAFVGRELELASLRDAFAQSCGGRPATVFINGPSGIGKTALCERFAKELSGRARVLRGRCYDRETLPFNAFDGLIDALSRHLLELAEPDLRALLPPPSAAVLCRVFPSLRECADLAALNAAPLSVNQEELRQQAFAALKTLLSELARREPLVLIVDDLQWADLDSARLLHELFGPPSAPQVVYIGCYRSEEESRSEFLHEVFGKRVHESWVCESRQITLGPLARAEASDLVLQLWQGSVEHPELAITHIIREAAGSPFFVNELAVYFANRANNRDASLSLSELLAQRVAALTPTACRALKLLAIAARPVSEQLLALALNDQPASDRGLRALLVSGLARCGLSGELVLYHDRLREQIVQTLASSDVAALHRLLADTYERAQGAEPEWLIEHWRGAGEPARARDYALSAAGVAMHKLAFNRAAALYKTTLELTPNGDSRRSQLHADAGDALVKAGRAAEAAAAFVAALDGADETAALALRCRAVQYYLRSGGRAEAYALLEPLLHEVGVAMPRPPKLYWRLLLSRVRIVLHRRLLPKRSVANALTQRRLFVLQSVVREVGFSDGPLGLLLHSLFYENALCSTDPYTRFMVLVGDSSVAIVRGGYRARHRVARRIAGLEEMATSLGSADANATVCFLKAIAALFEGRYADASGLATKVETRFREECLGASWEETLSTAVRHTALSVTGPLHVICDDAPRLLRRAHERSDRFPEVLLSRSVVQALLAQDRPDKARDFIAGRLANPRDGLTVQSVLLTQSLADTLCYMRDHAAAWQTLDRVWMTLFRRFVDRSESLRVLQHGLRGRLAVGLNAQGRDRSLIRIAVAEVVLLQRIGRADADVGAAGIQGALAWQRGDTGQARQHLEHAEGICRHAGFALHALVFRRQLGMLLGGICGQRVVSETESMLRAQGVVNPQRWSTLYLAGFDTHVGSVSRA